MSKAFDIIELNCKSYKYMVINKDITSITHKMKEVEQELCKKSFSGNVLFNCLTSCRDIKKSYSSIYFDGNCFKASTWQDVCKIENAVSILVKNYFSKNANLLENPLLPVYL